MNRKISVLLVLLLLGFSFCRADEGMWIPMLLKKYNIEDMQKKGFKLSAEDIYDINRASLKDAVIGLGNAGNPFHHFCTAELISGEGLIVTNHHCAFSMIQSHSSLENNYLRDGFWAREKAQELTNPGITASILVRMEDVTDQILSEVDETLTETERNKVIGRISRELEKKAVEGTDLAASVKPYFNGNQFFLSVFRIFKDVRLVGAPPSAIGKFGGDTDNWMWPRHTGDFSLLRIYAGENNEPAEFSLKNKPYRPAAFFKISAKKRQEGDFTMVFGYPGTTKEYLPSFAIKQIAEIENPNKIAIRTAKLNILNAAMDSDELLRIKYAAKAAGVANSWKKWQGECKGLERFHTVKNKQRLEADFRQWAAGNEKYKDILGRYEELYKERKDLILASAYANEAGMRGAEIIGLAYALENGLQQYPQVQEKEAYKENLIAYLGSFYKDYDLATDTRILTEMLALYRANLPQEWMPAEIYALGDKEKIEKYVRQIIRKSLLASPEGLETFLRKMDEKSEKRLEKDPVYRLAQAIRGFYQKNIRPGLNRIEKEIRELDRRWLAGLMEMNPEKIFYADANSTLRVAYGQVGGYTPEDAVYYTHYTTLQGIMEKDNPAIYDYNVPQKLRELYQKRDFGPYAQDGEIPVCFIANNHTTGGNSGSPVLDAEGQLIGINFDRAWDGVMSDMQYDPGICRNIAVDIRYVLFIIDKLAGAGYLLDEMDISY